MEKKHRKMLEEIFSIQSYSGSEFHMVDYVLRKLEEMNLTPELDPYGNILVQKGYAESYPCYCAHLDTVHKIISPNDYKINISDTRITSGNVFSGVGGDDKCGIFALLVLLDTETNIKCGFFTQEERGWLGSDRVDLAFFADVNILVSIDRKGDSEYVLNRFAGDLSENSEKILSDIFSEFKFWEGHASVTDAFNLQQRLCFSPYEKGVAAVNYSCGYMNPHTKEEWVHIPYLEQAIIIAKRFVELTRNEVCEWIATPRKLEPNEAKFEAVVANIHMVLGKNNMRAIQVDEYDDGTLTICTNDLVFMGKVNIDPEGDEVYTCINGDVCKNIKEFIKIVKSY